MSTHANRLPQNPDFVEAQRAFRDFCRAVGVGDVKTGQIVLHMADYQVQAIDVVPPPYQRLRLHRCLQT